MSKVKLKNFAINLFVLVICTARRPRGSRSKTRQLMRKRGKKKKVGMPAMLKEFEVGEQATLVLEPAVQKGLPHPRFYGKVGRVIEKRGQCYVLEIKDGEKTKFLVAHPVHLKKMVRPEVKPALPFSSIKKGEKIASGAPAISKAHK